MCGVYCEGLRIALIMFFLVEGQVLCNQWPWNIIERSIELCSKLKFKNRGLKFLD